jgi:uncharacterized membrane protein (UPF0127 family)
MQIVNVTRNQPLCDRCRLANTFWKRTIGLLNRNSLRPGEGLLLDNCHGIHTVGMRFAIDVIFLDKNLRVTRQVSRVRPFHIGPAAKDAVYVLELPSGIIEQTKTEVGDQVQFRTGSEPPPNPGASPSEHSLSPADQSSEK